MKPNAKILLAFAWAGLLTAAAVGAADFAGTARVGYVYVDDEGNRGVFQPTYNLYEGMALSLDDFYYALDNGLRFYGDLRNVTLNNRHLSLGASKSGLLGVELTHNQYRRVYSFEGDKFTRRYNSRGQVWFKPHRLVKFFGGLGMIEKRGDLADLLAFSPLGAPLRSVDYTHTFYNTGVTVGEKGRFVTLEYRGSQFSDDVGGFADDRMSRRFRISAYSPFPNYEKLALNVGAQHYAYEVEHADDTLKANTFWGGARYFINGGWSLRYSFVWDRARRTGDLVSTDNITNALYADKVFKGIGGFTLGYQHHINDDVRDEIRGNSYVVSGFVRPVPNVTLRAGHGADMLEVKEGRTLTGDEDRVRFWGSLSWRYDYGMFRVKLEDRSVENDDIGASADYFRAGADLTANYERFGELSCGYAYYNGEYHNTEGSSCFEEHVVTGDVLSSAYYGFQGGFGGMYMRSRLDADVESFTVSFKGMYTFMPRHKIEVMYSAHNFDNFADLSPFYREYYTANVVEVNLLHEF